MTLSPLDRAIAQAGSGAALAKAVGVTPMAVSQWKLRGVPAHQVLSIESATGVSRHDLRPDIYPETIQVMDQMVRPTDKAGQTDESAVQASSAGSA